LWADDNCGSQPAATPEVYVGSFSLSTPATDGGSEKHDSDNDRGIALILKLQMTRLTSAITPAINQLLVESDDAASATTTPPHEHENEEQASHPSPVLGILGYYFSDKSDTVDVALPSSRPAPLPAPQAPPARHHLHCRHLSLPNVGSPRPATSGDNHEKIPPVVTPIPEPLPPSLKFIEAYTFDESSLAEPVMNAETKKRKRDERIEIAR